MGGMALFNNSLVALNQTTLAKFNQGQSPMDMVGTLCQMPLLMQLQMMMMDQGEEGKNPQKGKIPSFQS
jgi:hypothetical protein